MSQANNVLSFTLKTQDDNNRCLSQTDEMNLLTNLFYWLGTWSKTDREDKECERGKLVGKSDVQPRKINISFSSNIIEKLLKNL